MSAANPLDTYLDTRTLSALDMIERMSADDWRASAVQWARYAAVFAEADTDARKRAADTRQRTPKRKQRTATGHGYRKNMRARSDVLKHFLARPADINRSARDLQADIRASKSTINAVQQQIARAAETANMTAEEMLRRMRK